MEAIVSKALAWCGAHWEIVSTILGLLAYAWLNAKNARTAVEKRGGSWLVRVIDAASVATMAGAKNKASAPILGKSIVDAARAEVERQMAEPRETIAPEPPAPDVSGPRKSEPGFIDERVLLGVVALACIVALALSGCAASPPNVQAIPPYVVEREGYGSCAETGGKIEVPRAGVVALLTSVCWLRADSGLLAIDASAEPAIDPKDGGIAGEGE